MTAELSLKKKTLEKLKEESKEVRQYANVIYYLWGFITIVSGVILLIGLLCKTELTEMLMNPATKGLKGVLEQAMSTIIYDYTESQPLNSAGQFNRIVFVSNLGVDVFGWGLIAYVARLVKTIFASIEQGESPFEDGNVSKWKKCAKLFSGLAMAYFYPSMFLRGASFQPVLLMMLVSSFFAAIARIFEYGSCLQIESDETL